MPDRIILSLPVPSSKVNFNNFLLLGTSSQFFTFTTLKSDLEKASKSTSFSNKGSTFILLKSNFFKSVVTWS